MAKINKIISVVITCRNEEKNIYPMYERIRKVFSKLKYDFECIYVDNDSSDKTWTKIEELGKKDKRVKGILMSRDFGSPQPSFIAGLSNATGKACVLLHGDIQDPPELIPKFLSYWEKGYDVVYGVRNKRKGYGFVMNLLFKAFYYIFSKLSYVKVPINAGEFSLVDRKVVHELLKIKEYDYYLRFLRAFVGFNQIGLNYEREVRFQGASGENIFTYLTTAKSLIINYSFKPLELISSFAFIIMLLTFILIIINLILYFVLRESPRGIPTIVILVLFLGGVQLLCLSVIAEYLAKIFLEVKSRPRYIIRKTLNLNGQKNSK